MYEFFRRELRYGLKGPDIDHFTNFLIFGSRSPANPSMKQVNFIKFGLYAFGFLCFYFLLVTIFYKMEVNASGTQIQNFGDALWWSVVTLTTVGYGDIVPHSEGGRIIGFIFLFLSLGTYAFLIGQISSIMNNIKENRKLGQFGTRFSNHVVIIGWTEFGKSVTDELLGAGRDVAIVTSDKNNVDLIREVYSTSKVFVLFTDYHNVDQLTKVNIEESSNVFINLQDDTEKLVYILNMKKTYPGLKYVVTLENANLKNTFLTAGVTYAISKNELASKLLASYIFEPDVAILNEEILAYADTDEKYDMKEYKVLENNPYRDKKYGTVFYDLKKECNVILVGLVKNQEGERKLFKNADDEMLVEAGDYLIMLMNKIAVKKLTSVFKTSEGLD